MYTNGKIDRSTPWHKISRVQSRPIRSYLKGWEIIQQLKIRNDTIMGQRTS